MMAEGESILARAELKALASMEIGKVMTIAESTGEHTPGSWTREGAAHHLPHVLKHSNEALSHIPFQTIEEFIAIREELTHALTRAAMALWCYDHGLLGDMGPEGKYHLDAH